MTHRLWPLACLFGLGVTLFCSSPFGPSARAGTITSAGFDNTGITLTGADYYYPTGQPTQLLSTSVSVPNNSTSANLSLERDGVTDGIVTVSGKASVMASQTIDPSGNHATASITLSGATTTTGAYNYQAQVLAQSYSLWYFYLSGPTFFHYDYSGSANLLIRDPSGFDGYTYTSLGSNSNAFLPETVEWSPTTFSKSDTLLLGPGLYEVTSYQQSYDTQNPYAPGTYAESTFSQLNMSLSAAPEPSSLALGCLGVCLCLSRRLYRKWA